jgi:pimeloyl-ACP methyl ester carboxylesterase
MRTARNGDIELAYDVQGEGADLLLISGSASTRPLWTLVRPQWAQRFRTIAFDLRDSGASSVASEAYTLRDLAGDAVAVLDSAGSSRAHVVGHSLGGAIAQELAFARGDRLASLTFVSTWARGDLYAKNVMQLLLALTESVPDDRTLLAAILFAGAGMTTLRSESLFDMADAAVALGSLAPRAALARQWRLDLTVDTLDRLPGLTMPVHVVWGAEDRLLPQWYSQQILDAVPHAVGTAIDASGHLVMVAAPESFGRAVARFIDVTERRESGSRGIPPDD